MKKKKILVTGGSGFIGTEIVKRLLNRGYEVVALDYVSKPGLKKAIKGYTFAKVDLTDYVSTKKAFKGADICINLAAKIGGIGYFHKYPATILSDNNKIYSSTFEAAVANDLERMIYISSSMVYECTSKFPSKENDVEIIPPPVSAYGFSKLVGEQYCKAFYDQFGLAYTIVRPFNAYGVHELPEKNAGVAHVIPDMINKILSGQYPLEIFGDGKQVRCFTHVTDIADGIIAVMESKKTVNKSFNLANPEPIMMLKLAEMLWEILDMKKEFKVKHVKGFSNDVKNRIPDITEILNNTSWEPKITLEHGLTETAIWLKSRIS